MLDIILDVSMVALSVTTIVYILTHWKEDS